MIKHLFAIATFTIAFAACGPVYVAQSTPPPPPAPVEEAPEITYQTFYDDLSPYGQWIDYPDYGYVWMPNAGPDFRPYATNGQWVYTDNGWAWSSGYNWGWATFHYGRWFFDQNYGWMWIPGYQWAPAWVSWRRSPDYYGWAPLGPRVTVEIAVSSYNPPANYWCFVPHQYVASPSVSNYYVNQTRNTTIINNTTVINNNYTVNNNNTVVNNNTVNNNVTNNRTTINNNVRNNFVAGPDPKEVSQFTGTTIRPAAVRQSTTPGERFNNGQLEIYHPRVNTSATSTNTNASANNAQQRVVAPTHVVPLSNARPMFNRPVNAQSATAPTNNGAQNNNEMQNENNQLNHQSNTTPPSNILRQEPSANPTNNPANSNNTPDRVTNNQNQQPVNNNGTHNNQVNRPANSAPVPIVKQTPANNTNNNPVNTSNTPNRTSNNPNPQPAKNNNNPTNNSGNKNQISRSANGQTPQNNNPGQNNNQHGNKKPVKPKDKPKDQDKNQHP